MHRCCIRDPVSPNYLLHGLIFAQGELEHARKVCRILTDWVPCSNGD